MAELLVVRTTHTTMNSSCKHVSNGNQADQTRLKKMNSIPFCFWYCLWDLIPLEYPSGQKGSQKLHQSGHQNKMTLGGTITYGHTHTGRAMTQWP